MSDAPISGGGASAPASSGASSASAPSAPSTPAGATSTPQGDVSSSTPTPAAATPGQGQPPQTAEPPRERWDSILENARRKTRAEVEAEYRQRYGKYDQFESDPFTAVQNWISQASQHPLYGQPIQQWLQQQAQGFAQRQQPRLEQPKPSVPIVDAQGRITGYTYDAEGLEALRQYDRQQLQDLYDKRLGPLEQFAQQQRQREQQAQMEYQANQQAAQTLTALREQPYFKEHEADIAQALAEHEEWGANVHQAYNHVLVTKILPNLSQAEQQRVVDTINQKAGAGTISPRGTASGTPQFKSFATAARYFAEHPEEAADWANRR